MDYKPNQMVRMVQYGLKDKLLSSSTIWICATCETCVTRCPNDVDIPRMMDTLREMALKEKASIPERDIKEMHKAFLGRIRAAGRVHELSMIVLLKLKTRKFFKDVPLGVVMFAKGKLKLLPEKIEGVKDIRRIFAARQGK
jgi:heterodisulfide reductase subunit C